jgi:hypothetical protein
MQERRIQIVPQSRDTVVAQTEITFSARTRLYFPILGFTVLDRQSELDGQSEYETFGGGEIEF